MHYIKTDKAPLAPTYFSQGLMYAGKTIELSGQIGLDKDTMKLIHGGIEAECHQIIKNIKLILKEVNSSLLNITKCRIYLTDMSLYDKFNKVYASYFSGDYSPTRVVIGVKELPLSATIEFDVTAVANY